MPIDLVPLLASAAIRPLGLGLAALVGLCLLHVRSSGVRHAAWTVVLAGMLLQIPLEVMAPAVPLKALPTFVAPVERRAMESTRISIRAQTPIPADYTRTERSGRQVSWGGTFTGLYCVIAMLLFARMAVGFRGLRRIRRDARPVLGLGPGVFESGALVVPGSAGCYRARIFLPRAWQGWDAGKLRAVLAHERAHVRRRDWLIRVVSQVNVCIFWFHPLAWWMERELARLAEEACDDVALSEVENGEQYAATLVEIAQAAATHGGVLNGGLIAMAKESNVARRVNRILDRTFPIPKPLGRAAWVVLFVCSLPAIYLSAAVKLTSANRDSAVLEHAAPSAHLATAAPAPFLEPNPSGPIAQAIPEQPLRPRPPLTPRQRAEPSIAMCILIDSSGSMRDQRARVKAVALGLVKASNSQDEVCVINFNDEAFNDLPHGKDFTSDIKEMAEALAHVDSRGGSAMRDAIRMALDHLEQAAHRDRKVLVVVTDGNDTSSTLTQEQLLDNVRNSHVLVYSVGLLNENDPAPAHAARLALGVAEASGGRAYYPKDVAELDRIPGEIVSTVRTQ